jgi:hypothetical protein
MVPASLYGAITGSKKSSFNCGFRKKIVNVVMLTAITYGSMYMENASENGSCPHRFTMCY